MRRIIARTILVGVFLIGLIIFCYPSLNGRHIEKKMDSVVEEFRETTAINHVTEKQLEEKSQLQYNELYEKMVEYNRKIREEGQRGLCDPWAYEKSSFQLEEYGVSSNVIGTISIPKMEITMPIYLGATVDNMKNGAVHLSQTSLPIGGEGSNSVIAAHRGYGGAAMFRHIEYLEEGDQVIVQNLWEELTYVVTETKIISPTEISEILIQENRDLITLITCHPYTKNYQRYVVYCERQL